MDYLEAKVYFDGSHYIAIPHTEKKKKNYTNERMEEWKKNASVVKSSFELMAEETESFECNIFAEQEKMSTVDNVNNVTGVSDDAPIFYVSGKDKEKLFEELYKESVGMKGAVRRAYLLNKMKDCFDGMELAEKYVDVKLERKSRNRTVRRTRMARKAYLAKMNYFCTFTYDDRLHTEQTFKRKLTQRLASFAKRKGWKYIGVWERAPATNRLHFHGLFNIPQGTLPGALLGYRDYNTKEKRMQDSFQSLYFNEQFGRSDLKEIRSVASIGQSLSYMMKYIEKSGERIVYSKNLPQYFISDIMHEDIVCKIGLEDRKLLLFDDFTCWDEGTCVGVVSEDVIKQLRTAN